MAVSRRTFIKTGIIGGVLLAGAGYATRDVLWGGGAERQTSDGEPLQFLTQKDYLVLAAIASVILEGALPEDEASRKKLLDQTLRDLDKALPGLQIPAQKELRQLFGLLKIPVTRMLAARVFSSWEKASEASINAWLTRWRNSDTDLFRTAYNGLHQLIMGSWYGGAHAWASVGYPGPPLDRIPKAVLE